MGTVVRTAQSDLGNNEGTAFRFALLQTHKGVSSKAPLFFASFVEDWDQDVNVARLQI